MHGRLYSRDLRKYCHNFCQYIPLVINDIKNRGYVTAATLCWVTGETLLEWEKDIWGPGRYLIYVMTTIESPLDL